MRRIEPTRLFRAEDDRLLSMKTGEPEQRQLEPIDELVAKIEALRISAEFESSPASHSKRHAITCSVGADLIIERALSTNGRSYSTFDASVWARTALS